MPTIQSVKKHKSKGNVQAKFIVKARDPKHHVEREYLFKCESEAVECDIWYFFVIFFVFCFLFWCCSQLET